MKCINCIHYNICAYHIDEEDPFLSVDKCPHGFKHTDQYVKLPAYVGQPVWTVTTWYSGEVEIRKGKVSMLQQKADMSWKFRVSINGSVGDYTPDDIGAGHVFFSEKDAIEEHDRRVRELRI
jgi:hypothetical protein